MCHSRADPNSLDNSTILVWASDHSPACLADSSWLTHSSGRTPDSPLKQSRVSPVRISPGVCWDLAACLIMTGITFTIASVHFCITLLTLASNAALNSSVAMLSPLTTTRLPARLPLCTLLVAFSCFCRPQRCTSTVAVEILAAPSITAHTLRPHTAASLQLTPNTHLLCTQLV